MGICVDGTRVDVDKDVSFTLGTVVTAMLLNDFCILDEETLRL